MNPRTHHDNVQPLRPAPPRAGKTELSVLIVAFEKGRWGPARLPKALAASGFRVFALCPEDNALSRTRFLTRHFPLTDTTSSKRLEKRLAEVMAWSGACLIIPSDEQTVACLQAIVREAEAGRSRCLTSAMKEILIASLGDPAHFDDMLLKTHTLALAQDIGVPVPESRSVKSSHEAVREAERIGYPVYVKTSFSWAGLGATLCENAAQVAAAIEAAKPADRFGFVKRLLKKAMGRDWYPTDAPIDVQKAIRGAPAMFNAVALSGTPLAGFAGRRHEGAANGGPSSVVWLGAHAEMERAAFAMIRAMGASGFVNFDFMIEDETGDIYLLECNPRPSQVMHLGETAGVNVCDALARGLRGEPNQAAAANTDGRVTALFPQEWLRDRDAALARGPGLDAPLDDPKLLEYMIEAGGGDLATFLAGVGANASRVA